MGNGPAGDGRIDLKGAPLGALEELFARWGKERYRARQLSRWMYRRLAVDFEAMTDLAKDFRGELSRACRISSPEPVRADVSADGTEKYLLRLEDGERVESVLIPDAGRRTLCISSQVGCALRCGFCATGAAGFRRNMSSAEIVNQVCHAARLLAGRGERLSNVVFMGMGEPLENAAEVTRAIRILLSPEGFALAGKRVTVSTAGIVPALRAMAAELPVSFAVSINAARDDLRSRLMPVNRKYPLRELVAALRAVPLRAGRKVTAEYVLLAGVNDAPSDARALAALFRGSRVKVNLIPCNTHPWGDFAPPAEAVAERFREVLVSEGVQTITRERRGADIRAACGQLRAAEIP